MSSSHLCFTSLRLKFMVALVLFFGSFESDSLSRFTAPYSVLLYISGNLEKYRELESAKMACSVGRFLFFSPF